MAAATPQLATADAVRAALKGKRADYKGIAFQSLLLACLLVALLILVVLLIDVGLKAAVVFRERGLDFVTSDLSSIASRTGIAQGIRGTAWIGFFVAVLAFPLGIAAAIYLEEYAGNTRLRRIIDVNIRNLAGVPSVVYGILALAVFVKALRGFTGGRSLLAAGLTMAILVLPIVIITTAEALRAVPNALREAAFGVGATRWEVVRKTVLPYAAPGILTGTVLSLSRALGEAAPLLLIGIVTGFFAQPDLSIFQEFQSRYTALPASIFQFARQPGEDFQNLTAAAIVVLLAIVLLANSAAILLRNYYDKKR